jgi:chloramphenicol-sensitive protein RarD
MLKYPTSAKTNGLILGLSAYLAWGMMPLYFVMVREIQPWQMLCHRVVWSFLFLLTLILSMNKWQAFCAVWSNKKNLGLLAITAILIAGNWLLYIMAVSNRQVQQASLGYYISPVLTVFMGMAILGEKMRPLQWASLCVALAGASYLTYVVGIIPYLAIGLALTFSLYGIIRKLAKIDAVVGLAWETTILLPIGMAGISGSILTNAEVFSLSPQGFWIASSGIITILPLLLFTAASQRLPMILIGFFQYLSPTIQLAIATMLLNEDFDSTRLPGFLMIWIALFVFCTDTIIFYYNGVRNENISI